ncbi:MAG: type I-A CRISPR-associated protein Cas5a [Candidatus Bathyarchaeia archaeon]
MDIDNKHLYLEIDCALHWGWRLNLVPFSKSRPSLRVLPPTTLIGALAFPINRSTGFPETCDESSSAERLRQSLKYVGYRIDSPLIEYSDLSKVSFYYRGKARTDAVAVGKTYSLFSPHSENYGITICYIIDESKVHSIFSKSRDVRKELFKAACSITRLGSRESIAIPLKVSFGEAKLLKVKSGETSFSFLKHMVTSVKGNYIVSQVFDWEQVKIGNYKNAKLDSLIVPYNTIRYASETVYAECAKAYVFYDVGGELVIGREYNEGTAGRKVAV